MVKRIGDLSILKHMECSSQVNLEERRYVYIFDYKVNINKEKKKISKALHSYIHECI